MLDLYSLAEEPADARPASPSKRYMTDRYADYEYEDETSAFDPKGSWVGGCEYYSRTYRCRVPRRMLEAAEKTGDFDKLNDWMTNNSEKEIYY